MKDIFIKKMTLEKIRNLDYTEIPLAEEKKHLIITGKNGSGKTTILDSLAKTLDVLATSNEPTNTEGYLKLDENNLKSALEQRKPESDIQEIEKRIENYKKKIDACWQGFKLEFNCPLSAIHQSFERGEFVVAYYKAERTFAAEVPEHVEKVNLKDSYRVQDEPRRLFVKYLLDLEVTKALAISHGKTEKAEQIGQWFHSLEKMLQQIFENKQLHLEFDEDTYRFYICEPNKEKYDFNTLSSGYAAILDIVVDLIMRMEKQSGRKFQYDIPGIVLIDEIETHLHLELQRKIMEFLTTIFPHIQFIVSTHSPFILNSLPDTVIYDLEQKVLVKNGLTDVPYDGIVEGYFQANTMSDILKEKFQRYKTLTEKKNLTDDDVEEIAKLELYLDEIPDYLAIGITTEYQRLKLKFAQREDIDG